MTLVTQPREAPFEELVFRLEEVVRRLESSDLPLEEAIAAYQEGVMLAKEGHARLQAAERKIEELTRGTETQEADLRSLLTDRSQSSSEDDSDEADHA